MLERSKLEENICLKIITYGSLDFIMNQTSKFRYGIKITEI
jgi:hypothetical protein